ncbi:hypothetical protein V9T40_008079 [Parthenolecanium corni]|uniref:Uncharacterized protein n=1 Tax=Parthenolecanium corni TaxID=536013 RepID=A0AAN9TNT6_9HEMI
MVKRDAKYKHAKSVVGQYIKGRSKNAFTKSKYLPADSSNLYALKACKKCHRDLHRQLTSMTTLSTSTSTTNLSQCTPHSYTTCDECTDAGSSWCSPPSPPPAIRSKHPHYGGLHSIVAGSSAATQQKQPTRPKAFIEECGPDLLCLNFSDMTKRRKPPAANLQEQRTRLATELQELKKVSAANEERISQLFKRLDSMKLSITLLNEEQQRLEHSKQIRSVNMRLLINMLRTRLENEHKSKHNYPRFEAETRIIRRLFEKFATLEELKMKLEYENTRSLYTIKELKRENAKLEEKRKELARQIDIIDSV